MIEIPLMRPLLPSLEAIAPYFREIDERRWYSNFGALETRLEKRLADAFERRAALAANGTTALSAALVAVGAKPGAPCLMPSWTFIASASAACAANLIPRFADVSEETWELDPERVRSRRDLAELGAVMPVSPFGSPIDTRAWDEFSRETGIPVVIDGAASFDTASAVATSHPGRAPFILSLHATKAFGIGEGGVILSNAPEIVERIRQICNFGIRDESESMGYNGKLSEYHAAVGHATLDAWPQRRAALDSRTQRYASELARLQGVRMLPHYARGWVSTYCTLRLTANARTVLERMAAKGIETRRWWRDGVHAQPAYRSCPHDDLPVTNDLAEHVLSVPFFHDMSDAQIATVVSALGDALR